MVPSKIAWGLNQVTTQICPAVLSQVAEVRASVLREVSRLRTRRIPSLDWVVRATWLWATTSPRVCS